MLIISSIGYSLIKTRVLWHPILTTYTPYHMPIKYRCPLKKSDHISFHVYKLFPLLWVLAVLLPANNALLVGAPRLQFAWGKPNTWGSLSNDQQNVEATFFLECVNHE